MKRILFLVGIAAAVCFFPLKGYSSMDNYCAVPPFLVRQVPPNILIVMDVSGSMQFPAHGPCDFAGYEIEVANCHVQTNSYDSATAYYGYFVNDRFYTYAANKFVENATCSAPGPGCIPGNFLNWATMSRIDVLRKVLIGGKSASQQQNVHTLRGEGGRWTYEDPQLHCRVRIHGGAPPELDHQLSLEDYDGPCVFGTLTDAQVKLDVPEGEKRGVIQNIADTDYDGNWDVNGPRFGLMVFASNNRYGCMRSGISGSNMSSFLNAVQTEMPYWGACTGEALQNALDYFEQDSFTYDHCENASYIGGPGSSKDPWQHWCQLSFVLLLTDGEWEETVDPVVPAREGNLGIHEDRDHDLRNDLDFSQVIRTHTVYAFSDTQQGRNSLHQTAIYGAFDDRDSNEWPYPYTSYPSDSRNAGLPSACDPGGSYQDACKEWDQDGDGVPDAYYEAPDGEALEREITQAIYDILDVASSATAVSVLSTSAEGQGSLFQAYFDPSVADGTRKVTWVGYLNALWLDQYGNMREDTNGDRRLVLTDDYMATFVMDESTGETVVKRYEDSDGDGEADVHVDTIPLAELHAIWKGGKELANTDANSRTVYTFVDADNDGVKDLGEWAADEFSVANASTLRPYLGVATNQEAENIIRFVRGEHVDGLRDRRLTVDGQLRVWQLSDIVHSTPTVVARPSEHYHLIYGDLTYYRSYRKYYEDRKTMVYVGANDGMLHAFSAGYYHEGDDPETGSVTETSWYSGDDIGKELWSYIPYNLLPHLKWLADHDYCHVYYVDLKPKVADARIFAADDTHPNGWGTILIGGMKLGGTPIEITDTFTAVSETRTFRSSYFALDITDPDNPDLLWEFTDADLGFTTSYPAIVRVGAALGMGTWYVILGSGPTTFDGGSAQTGYVYVLDLASGALMSKVAIASIDSDLTGKPAFMASPITIDTGLNYQVDVAYIGLSYQSTGWKGKMFRVKTNEDANPTNWQLSTFMSLNGPVTAAPVAAVDSFNRLWIYWGTGRYFCDTDETDTSDQALYGAWDPMTGTVAVSDLTDVTDVYVYEGGYVDTNDDGTADDNFKNYLDTLRDSYSSGDTYGWYLRLSAGERSLTKPAVIGGIVLYPTFKPNDDICGFHGESYLYALYYETGTAYSESVIGTGDRTVVVEGEEHAEILRKTTLGWGVPTNAAIHVGKQQGVVSLIQLGTGVVKHVSVVPAMSPRSGVVFWRDIR